MLSAITNVVIRGRWLFLVLWIAIAVGISLVAPNLLDEANKSQQLANAQAKDEATRASNLIAQEFPQTKEEMDNLVTVILYRGEGLTDADQRYGKELEQFLGTKSKEIRLKTVLSPFSNPQYASTLISKDKQAALVYLNITITPASENSSKWLEQVNTIIPKIRSYLSSSSSGREGAPVVPAGLQVHLTGGNAVSQEVFEIQNKSLSLTLIMTIVFILLVLLIIYRSPIAAIFPLISVVLALIVAQGVIAFAAKAGLSVTPAITEFLIVLLFGAGTDYCLLIVSRFKEHILQGESEKQALRLAVPSASEAIISSAFAVIVAFLCMGFAQNFVFRALGPGIAIAVFIELLIIMTLIPAIIAVLGEKIFWPFLPSKIAARRLQREREGQKPKTSIWEKIARSVALKPIRYIICTLVVLVPFIILLQDFSYDNDVLSASLPTSTESYKGLHVVSDHFGAGAGAGNAATIIIKSSADLWSATNLRTIEELCANLDKVNGVAQVATATRPFGVKLSAQALQEKLRQLGVSGESTSRSTSAVPPESDTYSLFELPGNVLQQYPFLKPYMQAYIASNGKSVLVNVTLKQAPYSNEAISTISAIRNTVKFTLQKTELQDATASVGGVTALVKDLLDTQRADFIFITIVVLSAIYLILAFLLRSIIAPLYMVATILLSFASTIGITFVIFKYGFGHPGILSTTPIYSFVILVALGIDYNIFLMARIKEEYYTQRKPTHEAVIAGLATTGSIITSCGIIMVGTFSAFLLSPIRTFLEMGFGIVVGLLLDTFVIRTLLVPALAVKIGELNWWPKRRIRITSEERDRKIEEEDQEFVARNSQLEPVQ